MKIMYFGNDQQFMEMKDKDPVIEVPYIIRICKSISSVKVMIIEDPFELTDMAKNQRYKPDKFIYHTGKLQYKGGETRDKNNWEWLDWPEDLGQYGHLIDNARITAFDYWLKTRCDIVGYQDVEMQNTMGKPYYYSDVTLNRFSNSVCHLFGTGKIFKSGIVNSLLYIHGDYQII